MKRARQTRSVLVMGAVFALLCASMSGASKGGGNQKELKPEFQTSDRCLACHNGLTTPSGKDVSIGFDWRSSIMANSARDPYWQASVRREDLDHPVKSGAIQDECSTCHMPMERFSARAAGGLGVVFARLPTKLGADPLDSLAADGVSCTTCHQ